jgi:hypothetical protein
MGTVSDEPVLDFICTISLNHYKIQIMTNSPSSFTKLLQRGASVVVRDNV